VLDIYRRHRKKSDFFDIFEIFENITIFSNPVARYMCIESYHEGALGACAPPTVRTENFGWLNLEGRVVSAPPGE